VQCVVRKGGGWEPAQDRVQCVVRKGGGWEPAQDRVQWPRLVSVVLLP